MKRFTRTTSASLSAGALALALALSGCGGDDPAPASTSGGAESQAPAESAAPTVPEEGPTGAEAIGEARTNLDNLESVTVIGSIDQDGESMEVLGTGSLADDGNYSLEVSGSIIPDNGAVSIVRADGTYYINGSESYFETVMGDTDGQIADTLGDKYLEVPADQAEGVEDMTLKSFVDTFTQQDFDVSALKDPDAPGVLDTADASPDDPDGMQVYAYETNDNDGTLLYLTADGENQFAGIESPEVGNVLLSEHNQAEEVQAPGEDEVMTMEELQEALAG
ncbi:MAG: hypothetical protein ACTHW1_05325 [Ancrocorticia sp.]|uniref:hypothetical protein n=1 Tax=Ancrocorticia sp. TaxID=2593684 RepID=UPI003F92F3C0